MSAEVLKIVPEIKPGKKVAFTLGGNPDEDPPWYEGEYLGLFRLGLYGQPAHKVRISKSNPDSGFKEGETYYLNATHARGEDDVMRPPVEMRILKE